VETTRNAFLGGRLRLRQPRHGYRAGIDPVLLAAACPAAPGARVLELGCGIGTALFCLARRVPGLTLTGVERDAGIAALARENAADNGIAAEIVTADLAALPAPLRQRQFDLVLANPPYFDRGASTPSVEAGREAGRGEDTPLPAWIATAARRLAPRGRLVVIQQMPRLPEALAACGPDLGGLEVIPLQPRVARAARLFLLRAQKASRAAFCLKPPVLLHDGPAHVTDGDDYHPDIAAVLRDAAALPIG
jgi:tRNA1(Val) A37 N6-methylase TrmN6